jgi:hypothetical protein
MVIDVNSNTLQISNASITDIQSIKTSDISNFSTAQIVAFKTSQISALITNVTKSSTISTAVSKYNPVLYFPSIDQYTYLNAGSIIIDYSAGIVTIVNQSVGNITGNMYSDNSRENGTNFILTSVNNTYGLLLSNQITFNITYLLSIRSILEWSISFDFFMTNSTSGFNITLNSSTTISISYYPVTNKYRSIAFDNMNINALYNMSISYYNSATQITIYDYNSSTLYTALTPPTLGPLSTWTSGISFNNITNNCSVGIANFKLNDLTNYINYNIGTNQISALNSKQISALLPAQVNALTSSEIYILNTEQVISLSPSQINTCCKV